MVPETYYIMGRITVLPIFTTHRGGGSSTSNLSKCGTTGASSNLPKLRALAPPLPPLSLPCPRLRPLDPRPLPDNNHSIAQPPILVSTGTLLPAPIAWRPSPRPMTRPLPQGHRGRQLRHFHCIDCSTFLPVPTLTPLSLHKALCGRRIRLLPPIAPACRVDVYAPPTPCTCPSLLLPASSPVISAVLFNNRR